MKKVLILFLLFLVYGQICQGIDRKILLEELDKTISQEAFIWSKRKRK